jgi:hypothetical protein
MTDEKIKMIVDINKELEELKKAYKEVNNNPKYKLAFYYDATFPVVSIAKSSYINSLLDNYRIVIISKIESEITRLKNKLKEL